MHIESINNMITHLFQPSGSSLCGQTCVAMIAGKQIKDVVSIIGRGKTSAPALRKALRHFGFACSSRTERVRKGAIIPELVIIRLHYRGEKASHWTVMHKGKFYDPTYGIVEKYPDEIYRTSFVAVGF